MVFHMIGFCRFCGSLFTPEDMDSMTTTAGVGGAAESIGLLELARWAESTFDWMIMHVLS